MFPSGDKKATEFIYESKVKNSMIWPEYQILEDVILTLVCKHFLLFFNLKK